MRNSVLGQIFHVQVRFTITLMTAVVLFVALFLSDIIILFPFFVDRFWVVPINEPTVLLGAFLERFKSACLLEQQLPAMKPERLKSMV